MKKTQEMIAGILKPVIDNLSELKEVSGILCFGSYAIDTDDDQSDIDLFVLCRPDIPNNVERLPVIKKIKNSKYLAQDIDNTDIWENSWSKLQDKISINDKIIEIHYNTLNWVKNIIEKIKETSATTLPEMPFRPYTLLGLLENSIILFDPEKELEKIIDRLYPYPDMLKEKLIKNSLSSCKDVLIDLSNYVERNIGNTAFHFHFQRYLNSLYTLLFAINNKYDPATKHLEVYLKHFKILPSNFIKRYENVLVGPYDKNGRKKVVAELQNFVDEIDKYLIKCSLQV